MLLRASPPVLEKLASHEAVARNALHGEAVARGGLHEAAVEPAADDVVVLRQVLH
jgi:hypothetical protein